MCWGIGGQAGVQQGELAKEAAQVLGSWCHGGQRQQDIFVIDHSGDLDGTGRPTWGLGTWRAHMPNSVQRLVLSQQVWALAQ